MNAYGKNKQPRNTLDKEQQADKIERARLKRERRAIWRKREFTRAQS